MWEYRAKVVKIVDADTADFSIDCGFKVFHEIRLRVAGVDAPERFTDEGKAATAWLTEVMPVGSDVIIRTEKDKTGKYGRYIGWIEVKGNDLSKMLVDAGHAVVVDYD